MRRVSLLALLLIVLFVLPAEGRRRQVTQVDGGPVPTAAAEQDVLRDFERILDLWHEGRYNELYERTALSRESKEGFAKKLASAPRRPACCWEKMQDVQITLKGDSAAVVRARLGFEGAIPGTEYVTKGIKLKKEAGIWMISKSDLFSLAKVSKKRVTYKYLPTQPK
jgi:hypothetical protein